MSFFKKAFEFFRHPDTPGSGFYLLAMSLLSSTADHFLGSGNPWLMGVGLAASGVYAAANALANAVERKKAAAASAEVTDTSSPAPPVSTNTPPPPVGANAVPFGTAKVGSDDLIPPNSIQPQPAA